MSEGSNRQRLNGWKAVASHFRRDRSTVMRWSRERDLPFYRVPGGDHGSIFAFTDELDAWMARGKRRGDTPSVEPLDAPPPAAPRAPSTEAPVEAPASWLRRYGWLVALGVVALIGIALMLGAGNWSARRDRLPRNAAVAQDFVAARDYWARRSPADLETAIKLYRRVIAAEPTFAPAWVGLADTWLLAREYGGIDDATAYREAERTARQALALDPEIPGGLRALGFVSYWWRHDTAAAHGYFKRAIAADPDDAQSHFWYANMLSDVGDAAAADQAYDRARTLDPGSRPIAVERACALWQAGNDAEALRRLSALRRLYPTDATIHNCLAYVQIGRGDIRAFADAYRQLAEARNSAEQRALAAELDRAVARDPQQAHRVLIAAMREDVRAGRRPSLETAAYYASSMKDRPILVDVLDQAVIGGERWPSATIRQRIAERWRDDAEIASLITRLSPDKPKP